VYYHLQPGILLFEKSLADETSSFFAGNFRVTEAAGPNKGFRENAGLGFVC
jgi:hypothetical protein